MNRNSLISLSGSPRDSHLLPDEQKVTGLELLKREFLSNVFHGRQISLRPVPF
jgi:hypothetical protein